MNEFHLKTTKTYLEDRRKQVEKRTFESSLKAYKVNHLLQYNTAFFQMSVPSFFRGGLLLEVLHVTTIETKLQNLKWSKRIDRLESLHSYILMCRQIFH